MKVRSRVASKTKVKFFRLTFLHAVAILAISAGRAAQPLEEMIEQRYELGANPTLSIRNPDGVVRIYGYDGAELKIQALKRAYSAERLSSIVVDVKASPNSVSVETICPPADNKSLFADRSGTVDYTFVVPQTTRITRLEMINGEILVEGLRDGGSATATIVNGRAIGHNCFANLDLSVENGGVDFFYDWWEQHSFALNAATNTAQIRAALPFDATFEVDAKTTHGQIIDAFNPRRKKDNPFVGPVRGLRSSIAGGSGARFHLQSTNGNIRIEHIY